jgi:hypothetical protein
LTFLGALLGVDPDEFGFNGLLDGILIAEGDDGKGMVAIAMAEFHNPGDLGGIDIEEAIAF